MIPVCIIANQVPVIFVTHKSVSGFPIAIGTGYSNCIVLIELAFIFFHTI